MRLFGTAIVLLGSTVGLWLCARSDRVDVPPDPRDLAEERERKEQEDERRWRSALSWTDWATSDGVRLRAGLPRKIEIGVTFDVALEVESVPADARPGRRWLFGGWPPTAIIRFLDAGGAPYAEIREWTIWDMPYISVPPPDSRPSFDLTQPDRTFLRRSFVVPAAMDTVKPGRPDAGILFTRGPQDVDGLSPEEAWTGNVATPPLRLEVLPGSTETKTFLLPARLRLRARDMDDLARHSHGKDSGKRFLVTYSKLDAEKVRLTYPKGAHLTFGYCCREVEGMPGYSGLRGGPPQPDDINGIDQWYRIEKACEKTYDLVLTYTVFVPRGSAVSLDGPTVLWSRTLTVKYDPDHSPG